MEAVYVGEYTVKGAEGGWQSHRSTLYLHFNDIDSQAWYLKRLR